MDRPAKRKKRAEIAPHGGINSPNVGSLPSTAERPLTFQPALDDHNKLKGFLKGVFEKHLSQKQAILGMTDGTQATESTPNPVDTSEGAADSKPAASVMAPPPRRQSETKMPSKGSISSEDATQLKLAPTAAKIPSDTKKSPDPRAKTTTTPRRRSRAGNNASLLRARSIDFHAPDPEEESPPNETEDERRRRKERINGRRKRAKKMIEIDYLNEQYHHLKHENDRLRGENSSMREKIAMVRNLCHPTLSQQGSQVSADIPARPLHAQQPKLPQAGGDSRVPLVKYALPPAAMALRIARDIGVTPSQEESKESLVQPQFVGLERLGPAALSLSGNRTRAPLPAAPGLFQNAFANQLWSPFAGAMQQPRILPQSPPVFSILQQAQQPQPSLPASQPSAQTQAQASLLLQLQQLQQQLTDERQQQIQRSQNNIASQNQQGPPQGP